MPTRQLCTPHLIRNAVARPAERVDFGDRTLPEDRLQELLYAHPTLIPIDEIEDAFGPLYPAAREVMTPAGPVDLVYVNPRGYVTLVETKLFRNPEARREVVAQIIDYAAAMSRWTYADFREAVRSARRLGHGSPDTVEPAGDPLVAMLRDHPAFDEAGFIDGVSQTLARGRFLLLIVGDGVRDGVEQLADLLATGPQLRFTLALLEIAFFRAGTPDGALIAQPRVLARTREMVRAVIELRSGLTPADVRVSLPEAEAGGRGGERRRQSEEDLFESITAAVGPEATGRFRALLAELEALGVEVKARDASFSLLWQEPNTERRFTFGSVYADGGEVDFRFVLNNYRKEGIDEGPGWDYVRAVAELVPGAAVREGTKDGQAWPSVTVGQRKVTLTELLRRAPDWLAAVRVCMARTEQAGEVKSAE